MRLALILGCLIITACTNKEPKKAIGLWQPVNLEQDKNKLDEFLKTLGKEER